MNNRRSLRSSLFISALVIPSILFFTACAGSQAVKYQVPGSDRDPAAVLSEYTTSKGLPCAAMLALGPEGTLVSEIAGTRKAGSGVAARREDAFHLGSDTKAMTALLCAIAVDEGKLSWGSTVGEALGSAAGGGYSAVTLEQLLSHTSGLPDSLRDKEWKSFFARRNEPVEAERDRMARAALALAPASPPATAFLYSNFNYVLAGRMLESAYGKSWEALMRERLFEPLGMKDAGFGPPNRTQGVDALWGHSPGPVPYGPEADNPPALGPAGIVHASLADMEAYLRFLLNGGIAPDGTRLVSEESFRSLAKTRPGSGDYALGWVVGKDDSGGTFLGHDGSNTNFYCSITICLDKGYAFAVFANKGGADAAHRVAELGGYLVKKYLSPR
jgi:D-alanyl-D-alanine carboxypeptidase